MRTFILDFYLLVCGANCAFVMLHDNKKAEGKGLILSFAFRLQHVLEYYLFSLIYFAGISSRVFTSRSQNLVADGQ